MNTIEEIRIKSKIKNLVHGMLKNMTFPDGIESAETIIFCLRKLPDCQKEELHIMGWIRLKALMISRRSI